MMQKRFCCWRLPLLLNVNILISIFRVENSKFVPVSTDPMQKPVVTRPVVTGQLHFRWRYLVPVAYCYRTLRNLNHCWEIWIIGLSPYPLFFIVTYVSTKVPPHWYHTVSALNIFFFLQMNRFFKKIFTEFISTLIQWLSSKVRT